MNTKIPQPKPPANYGLLPYQSAFAANLSRFKIGLWARQTGKDHTATFEAVVDSIRNSATSAPVSACAPQFSSRKAASAETSRSGAPGSVEYHLNVAASVSLAVKGGILPPGLAL